MDLKFERIEPLFKEAFPYLQQQRVAVVGLGGVGGICAEALVRSGISKLVIVDFDKIEESNINRQNVALVSTLGQLKSEVLAKRLYDINPNLKLRVHSVFLNKANVEAILGDCVAVVDAIDNVKAKMELISYAVNANKVFISSMGMGNRLDPTKLEVSTISKTYNDPFAKQIRLKSKELGLKDYKVVFSSELPKKDSEVLTSFMPVTSTAGLILAAEIISDLVRRNEDE